MATPPNRNLRPQDLAVIEDLIVMESVAIDKWLILVGSMLCTSPLEVRRVSDLYTRDKEYALAICETLKLHNRFDVNLVDALRSQRINNLADQIESLDCWKVWKAANKSTTSEDATKQHTSSFVRSSGAPSGVEVYLLEKAEKLKYDPTNLEATGSKIFNALAAKLPGLVKRHKVAGSIGKRTAIRGYPDLDMIVFVDAHPPFKSVIEKFEDALKNSIDFKTGKLLHYENDVECDCGFADQIMIQKVTRYSLQFIVDGYEVDLLPATYFADNPNAQREKTLVKMKELYDKKLPPIAYNTSLCESTVQFMDRQTEDCRKLIRVLKYWARPPRVGKFLGKSYMLELIGIYAHNNLDLQQMSVAAAFRKCMELLVHFDKLKIILNEDPFLIPPAIKKGLPLIMDPINQFNNLCRRNCSGMQSRIKEIKLLARETIDILNSAVNQENTSWESLLE